MPQKHLLIIDSLDFLRKDIDTSLGLARALLAAGHEVWFTEISHLFWSSAQDAVHAKVQRLGFAEDQRTPLRVGQAELLSCAEFSSVLMRKDPPVDYAYLSCTWLLDSLQGKTRVLNSPASVRSINEKLGIFSLGDAALPALVSADPQQLLQYIEQDCAGDAISKPLDGFGGKGVVRINLPELGKEKALDLLTAQTEQGHSLRIVQGFNREIFKGEVRAFAVGGTPLAWCLKKPAAGSYLANTAQGAELFAYTPSAALKKKITEISRALWRTHGIAFVGFDIIGDKISEVNLTSPRLLQGKDDPSNYYHSMAQWLISHCASPLASTQRTPSDEL